MKKTCFILIAFFSSFALADGMPVPDPSVYFDLSEDHQIAIITIQEDLKASVDLFVSISDHSGESHQIQFILPFYGPPESFEVVEKNLSDMEEKTKQLDEYMEEFSAGKAAFGNKIFDSASQVIFPLVGNLPLAVTILLGGGLMRMAVDSDVVAPIMTLETEHSKVEVYNVSDQENLESILSKYNISEELSFQYMRYIGKYLYLVTLDTIPYSENQTAGTGILFSFTSPLEQNGSQYVYTYPLGTGSAWPKPIKLTRIYVRGPMLMIKEVQYPVYGNISQEYGTYLSSYQINRILEHGFTRKWDSYNEPEIISSGYTYDDVEGIYDALHRVVYVNANPNKEIQVIVENTPPGLLSKIGAGIMLFLYAHPYILTIPVLVVVWLIVFFFRVWPNLHEETPSIWETLGDRVFYKKSLSYFGIYMASGTIITSSLLGIIYSYRDMSFGYSLLSSIAHMGDILLLISPLIPPLICVKLSPLVEKRKEPLQKYFAFLSTGIFVAIVHAICMVFMASFLSAFL